MNNIDEYLDQLQTEVIGTVSLVLGVLSAANLIVGSTKLYKQSYTKSARLCSDLAPKEKALCMMRAKMVAKNIQLQSLKSNLSKCGKTKSPDDCKEKFSKQMHKLSDEIDFYSNRYNSIKKQEYAK